MKKKCKRRTNRSDETYQRKLTNKGTYRELIPCNPKKKIQK